MTRGERAAFAAALLAAVTLGGSAGRSRTSAEAQGPAPAPASGPESAADERLRRVQDRRAGLEREVAKLRRQEKTLLGEVERLELEVRLRSAELREAQLVLEKANEEIDHVAKRTQELEVKVAAERPVLASRARALYKLGTLSYVRMLLSVDRPSDFLRGYRFVTSLARRDNERFAGFRVDLAALGTTRGELQRRTQDTLALRATLERARRGFDAERARKTALLTRLVEKKELNAAYVQELAEAEVRLSDMLSGSGGADLSVPIATFKGSLPWPVAGPVKTAFGLRKHARFDTFTVQNGIEIDSPADATVAAVHEGRVIFADRFRGYGLMVVVDHGNKHHTLYAHLGELAVATGDHVAAGTTLGRMYGSGTDDADLYFEVRLQGRAEDPTDWLGKPEPR